MSDRPADAESVDEPTEMRRSSSHERAREIAGFAKAAREARESFEPPEEPDEQAMTYLEDGLWPVIDTYIDARADSRRFSPAESRDLERALNDWLAVYARCYDVEMEPEFAVLEAAELFVSTHNIRDTAQLLTDVPARSARRRGDC